MIFETALEYEEVVQRLKKHMGFFWSTVNLSGQECHIYGSLKGDGFKLALTRFHPGAETFPVFFQGKIERTSGGCRISGRYRIPLSVKLLLVLAISLAIVSMGFCFLDHSSKLNNEEALIFLPFLCFVVFVMREARRVNSNYVAAFFKSELKAKSEET